MGKSGRSPKITDIDLKKVERYGGLGLTDVEISRLLGISEPTLNSYKKKYPEFLTSLKRGKDSYDVQVLESLHDNCIGGVKTLKKQKVIVNKDTGKHTVVDYEEDVYIRPDTFAQIYWLNNRRRTEWKHKPDNYDDDGNKIPKVMELKYV